MIGLSVWALVLGLTPGFADAAPPRVELTIAPASDQPPDPALDDPVELPSVAPQTGRLEIITSATSIRVRAVLISDAGQPLGSPSEVVIDLGRPPIEATLPVGRWRLETEGRGYRPWSREIEIVADAETRVQVEPTLIDAALIELRAVDRSSEGAAVELDAVPLCILPCRASIEPGRHLLEITKRRKKPLRAWIDAAQADEIVIEVRLEPATSRAPAIVTGSVGLASLTTAIVFTARSAQTRRSLAADLNAGVQYDQQDRRIDNGRRDAIIATAMYGVTVAVGTLTFYYLLRQVGPASRAEKRRRSLAVVPSFGPKAGGLVLTVGF